MRWDGDKAGMLVFSELKNASRRTVDLPQRAVRASEPPEEARGRKVIAGPSGRIAVLCSLRRRRPRSMARTSSTATLSPRSGAQGYPKYAGTTSGTPVLRCCSRAASTPVRPAPRWARQHIAHPEPVLVLNAWIGKHAASAMDEAVDEPAMKTRTRMVKPSLLAGEYPPTMKEQKLRFSGQRCWCSGAEHGLDRSLKYGAPVFALTHLPSRESRCCIRLAWAVSSIRSTPAA